MTTHLAAFATAAHATAPIWITILTVACAAGWVADRWARSINQRADERDGWALVERRRPHITATDTGLCDGCQRLRLIVDTCPHSFSLCDECQEEPRCRECREPEWTKGWRLA